MNAAPPLPRRVPRWVWGAAAVFLGQVAVIWWLAAPGTPVPPPPDPWRGQVLASHDAAAAAWLDVLSPTAFLLAGAQDFSGPAWLRPAPAPYPAESFAAEPRPLPLPQAWSAAAPPDFPASLAAAPVLRWTPPTAATRAAPPLALAHAPRWRLLEAPAGVRLLEAPPPAAGPTNTEASGPVIVRVGFDAAGHVTTPPAVLVSGGAPAADTAAVQGARAFRFAVPAAAGRPGDTLGWAVAELDWGAGGAAP